MSAPAELKDVEMAVKKGHSHEAPKMIEQMTEHMLSDEDLQRTLKTSIAKGLTTAEAEARLARDGPNKLRPPPRTPWWKKLAEHLFGNGF